MEEYGIKKTVWEMIQHTLSISSKEERKARQEQRHISNMENIIKFGSLSKYRALRKHALRQCTRGLQCKGGKLVYEVM